MITEQAYIYNKIFEYLTLKLNVLEKKVFFFFPMRELMITLFKCLFQVGNMKKNGFCICRMLEMLDTSVQAELVKNETFIFKFRWVIVPSALGPSPPDQVNTYTKSDVLRGGQTGCLTIMFQLGTLLRERNLGSW